MEKKKIKEIRERGLKMLEKGIDMGGAGSKFNREKFYDEVLKHRLGNAYKQ